MKKVLAFFFVLFVIETYGVYGRAQADRPTVSCSMAVGPLCFAWEPNALGRALGDTLSADLEDRLLEAKKSWERVFEDQIAGRVKDKNKLGETLTDFADKARKGIEKIGESTEKIIDDPKGAAKEGLEKGVDVAKDGLEKGVDVAKDLLEDAQKKLDEK